MLNMMADIAASATGTSTTCHEPLGRVPSVVQKASSAFADTMVVGWSGVVQING